jgi:phage gp36-like protein
MAYAAVSDLVERYGLAEMIRLTAQAGDDFNAAGTWDYNSTGVVDTTRAAAAIADASAEIDSYLRRRYQTPVVPTTPELLRACCALTRHELAHGAGREPSTQMRDQRASVLKWLERVRDGEVFLDGAVPSGTESAAQVRDAGRPVFGDAGQWSAGQ